MSIEHNRHVVEELWRRFDATDFAVGDLLHDDFVCEWPQSRERIRGRDNFIAVNAHYPRLIRLEVLRIVAEENMVVTEVAATDEAEPSRFERAASFFELRDGRIVRLTEYWPEPFAAATWRSQWVESM